MIELKNITKIYKTKGGNDVRALDDVSLTFPEKGLVFILGKSGCGKSTLLNIAGGLDFPTSGEIVVKGRSSRDFSSSDLDSYRNTFVGFIFQEYNVLPEFSVKNNIILAPELQGSKESERELPAILEKVELSGLENRKPNTLSGGQKQRIAIARALIKNPQIIFADEPTGALDSETGKAVLDLLKKLSENKLVVVVSHDREFAQKYADRIIELHDGRIVSDSTLVYDDLPSDCPMTVSGSDVLVSGKIEEKMLEELNALLKEKKTLTLSLSDGVSGAAHFAKTDESKLERRTYTEEESRLIRSKFPMKYALPMGASGLKHKKFRLILTILLSVVALSAFGFLLSLMTFDEERVLRNAMSEAPLEELVIRRYNDTKYSEDFDWLIRNQLLFGKEEKEALEKELGQKTVGAFNFSQYGTFEIANYATVSVFGPKEISGFTVASKEDLHAVGRELKYGEMPQKVNEVVVSELIAKEYVKRGLIDSRTDEKIDLSSPEDLIGRQIAISGTYNRVSFTVVGIFSSPDVPQKFDELFGYEEKWNERYFDIDYKTYDRLENYEYELSSLYKYTFVSLLVVHEDFGKTYRNDFTYEKTSDFLLTTDDGLPYAASYPYAAEYRDDVISLFFGDKTELNENEILLSSASYLPMAIGTLTDSEKQGEFTKKSEELLYNSYDMSDADRKTALSKLILDVEAEYKALTGKEFLPVSAKSKTVNLKMKVVGCYIAIDKFSFDNSAYMTKKTVNALVPELTFDMLYTDNTSSARDLFCGYSDPETENEPFCLMENHYASHVREYSEFVEEFSDIFFWVGVVFAVFSSLLLFNFISVSISYKKKDIGILRALGARKVDVFKVFYSESMMIIGICYLLSLIASIALTVGFSNYLVSELNLSCTLFFFGPLEALILLVLAAVVAFISTILPVYLTAKKPPVEAIRAL